MHHKINRFLRLAVCLLWLCASTTTIAQYVPTAQDKERMAKQLEEAMKREATIQKEEKERNDFHDEYTRPIGKENRRRFELHKAAGGEMLAPPITDPKGPFLGDAAFEKKVWERLSADVVILREKKILDDAIKAAEQRLRDSVHEPENIRAEKIQMYNSEIKALSAKLPPFEKAERRASSLASAIGNLRDARGIRLIAPIAFESDIWSVWYGDHGSGSFVAGVLSHLRENMAAGVIREKVPFAEEGAKWPEATAIPWRKWFLANKEKYGFIYQLPPETPKPAKEQPKPEPAPEKALATTPTPVPPTSTPVPLATNASKAENPVAWLIIFLIALFTLLAVILYRKTHSKD